MLERSASTEQFQGPSHRGGRPRAFGAAVTRWRSKFPRTQAWRRALTMRSTRSGGEGQTATSPAPLWPPGVHSLDTRTHLSPLALLPGRPPPAATRRRSASRSRSVSLPTHRCTAGVPRSPLALTPGGGLPRALLRAERRRLSRHVRLAWQVQHGAHRMLRARAFRCARGVHWNRDEVRTAGLPARPPGYHATAGAPSDAKAARSARCRPKQPGAGMGRRDSKGRRPASPRAHPVTRASPCAVRSEKVRVFATSCMTKWRSVGVPPPR